MSIHLLLNGTLREVGSLYKLEDGALRRVNSLHKMQDGALRMATSFSTASPGSSNMTASVSPSEVSAFGDSRQPQTLRTDSMTLTPAGGTAPYSYAWSAEQATVASQGMATTAFRRVAFNTRTTEVVTCTVTDAIGNQATATGTATFTQSPNTSGELR